MATRTVAAVDLAPAGRLPYIVARANGTAREHTGHPHPLVDALPRPHAKPCRIDEADLDPGVKLVFKDFGDTIRMAYDPAQISGSDARQLLAIYVDFFESPSATQTNSATGMSSAEALRRMRAERTTAGGALRDFLDIVLSSIDTGADPAAVGRQALNLISQVSLRDLLIEHGVRLVIADGSNAHLLTKAILIKRHHLLLVPPGLDTAETLRQARAAIEETGQ